MRYLTVVLMFFALAFAPATWAVDASTGNASVAIQAIAQEARIVLDPTDRNFFFVSVQISGELPPNFLFRIFYGNKDVPGFNLPGEYHAGTYEVVVPTESALQGLVRARFPLQQKNYVVYYTAYIKELGAKLPNGGFEWESGNWLVVSQSIGITWRGSAPAPTATATAVPPPALTATPTTTATRPPVVPSRTPIPTRPATPTATPVYSVGVQAPTGMVVANNQPGLGVLTFSSVSAYQVWYTLFLAPEGGAFTELGSAAANAVSGRWVLEVPVAPTTGGIPRGFVYRLQAVADQDGVFSAPAEKDFIVGLAGFEVSQDRGGIRLRWERFASTTEVVLWRRVYQNDGSQGQDTVVRSFTTDQNELLVPADFLIAGEDYFFMISGSLQGPGGRITSDPLWTYLIRYQAGRYEVLSGGNTTRRWGWMWLYISPPPFISEK